MHAESVPYLEFPAISVVQAAVVFVPFAVILVGFLTLALFALSIWRFTHSFHYFAIVYSAYEYFLIRFCHLALDLLLVVEQFVGSFVT